MSDDQERMIEHVARAQAEAIFGKGVPLDKDDYIRARAAIKAMNSIAGRASNRSTNPDIREVAVFQPS
jgi:hypothetical protein